MTMEYATPGTSPLPGVPKPYFLAEGEGEKAVLIDRWSRRRRAGPPGRAHRCCRPTVPAPVAR
jgi:hypothetical protein